MNLTSIRRWLTPDRSISKLKIDNKFFSYILEDKVRKRKEGKIAGETAIPYGTYPIKLTYSNKFQKIMPEIMNVPGFRGIRFHPGHDIQNTEGC